MKTEEMKGSQFLNHLSIRKKWGTDQEVCKIDSGNEAKKTED